ncbi:MAG: ATP-dependent RNA helicase HrpA, partial [Pseudomonadota bacterium]
MSAVTDGIVRSIDQCMLIDRHKFKSRLKRSKSSQALDQLKSLIEQSKSLALSRQQEVSVEYPDSLPITQRVEDIKGCVRDHPVVIVAGETGSGKTTQLPKLLLDMGFGVYGAIGHTQPRRIAARSVANRISEELGSTLGNLVGFKVRFDDVTSPASRIKLMTDGILLAELANDPYLNQYDCLVIDEAHERSLNIDFLLGYLKRLISKRRDLKVIITSATLNTERFSKHFDNAPIIEVSGRTYPVEIRYRSADALQGDTALDIEGAIKELMSEGRGDILVFLPGERDIKEVQKHLQQRKVDADLLPLFGRLSASEQNRIFTNGGRRRVVLATNIAETSLTVPGIRYVVDPGVARISRYSYRTKVQRLPVEKISQASANQRAGRCGRVADGICIRLFDLEDYEARPEYTDPELLRTNLGSVILQMALLRLGDVESFPFVDPPDVKFVRDGYRLLQELKALGKNNRITTLGKKIARLPVDPRFGRMLIEAQTLGVLPSVRIIVAGLSVQDPRERPLEHAEQADQCHKVFQDEQS